MAKSNLTAKRLRELLDYDPHTGHMTWKANGWKHTAGQRAGGMGHSAGYRSFQIDKVKYLEHRLIYLHMTGEWPYLIDHINGDRLDNRWENLRNTTDRVNTQNLKRPQKNNKTGFLGVYWATEKKCFLARICYAGNYKTIGRFKTAEEAGAAYLEAKRRLHEGCTI